MYLLICSSAEKFPVLANVTGNEPAVLKMSYPVVVFAYERFPAI
jgi:hypothetical protein